MPANSTRKRGSFGFFRCPAAKAWRDSFHCCCLASAKPRRKSSSGDWPSEPCDNFAASSQCPESKAFCAAARREMRRQIVPLAGNGKLAKAGLAKIALHVRGENAVRLSRIQQFLNRRDVRPARSHRRTMSAPVLQEHRNSRRAAAVFALSHIRNLEPHARTGRRRCLSKQRR